MESLVQRRYRRQMDEVMVEVRDETPVDRSAIRRVTELAFGQPAEADLIDELRRLGAVVASLVAEVDGEVVGHILFSPVEIDHPAIAGRAVGLAPMAVTPSRQRRGIGSLLVADGLKRCRSLGATAAVVLGHAEYYPRFGFAPAASFGLRSEYPVPPEVFMAIELEEGALAEIEGLVTYHAAFGSV